MNIYKIHFNIYNFKEMQKIVFELNIVIIIV